MFRVDHGCTAEDTLVRVVAVVGLQCAGVGKVPLLRRSLQTARTRRERQKLFVWFARDDDTTEATEGVPRSEHADGLTYAWNRRHWKVSARQRRAPLLKAPESVSAHSR